MYTIYIYAYICTYTYMYMYIYTHTHTFEYIFVSVYTNINTHIDTSTCIWYINIHSCPYACICIFKTYQNHKLITLCNALLHTRAHTYTIHIYVYTTCTIPWIKSHPEPFAIHFHTHTHTCTYTYIIHTYTSLYILPAWPHGLCTPSTLRNTLLYTPVHPYIGIYYTHIYLYVCHLPNPEYSRITPLIHCNKLP